MSEDPGPGRTDGPAGHRTGADAALEPLALPMLLIVGWGVLGWVLALVTTLAVPALRTGERSWWPWCCVSGVVLGSIGWAYLRRGRGNAAEASGPPSQRG